jgi:hypothetical protein
MIAFKHLPSLMEGVKTILISLFLLLILLIKPLIINELMKIVNPNMMDESTKNPKPLEKNK